MNKTLLIGLGLVALGVAPASAQKAASTSSASAAADVASDPNQPPPHTAPFPNLGSGNSRDEIIQSFDLAPEMRRGIPVTQLLEDQRRLTGALDALEAQRPGTVDAYVITVALDSDPVFAREAREAGRVLSRRYDGEGRTLVLAGPDGERDDRPTGSIESLLVSIAHVSELMDKDEDVLVLYTTSHGNRLGLAYHYGDSGYGILSPARLSGALAELGVERRILIISACYSGVFVPALQSPDTAILTAASSERSSFGCQAENDWTFFGDALINNALREPQSLAEAASEAGATVAGWESSLRLLPSLPQVSIGSDVDDWLSTLEARMPSTATEPTGRPAVQ